MSRVKIKLCTPLHIGSGNLLQIGSDVVKYTKNGKNLLGVVDLHKVMKLIGDKRSDIDKWALAIERGESTADVVRNLARGADESSYVSRVIINYCKELKKTDTLKEFIHDGMNRPYIPGSSIKGAIRTAILASEANSEKPTMIDHYEDDKFGKNPQQSIFRFLSVGDAIIRGNVKTEALRLINLNEREKSFIDESKSQVTEVLPYDTESETTIKLNVDRYPRCEDLPRLPQSMTSIQKLFSTINAHTKRLLQYEIQYWKDRRDDPNADGVDEYLEQIDMILNEDVKDCETSINSCILRIGHASGWNFITGGWARNVRNFRESYVPKCRPKNNNYLNYDFPKSRRIAEDIDILGFVKLTTIPD